MLVGAAASLVNLITHAGFLGRSRFGEEDAFVPGFVQYAIVIVATGTPAHGGTFRRGDGVGDHHGLVGIAPPRVDLI